MCAVYGTSIAKVCFPQTSFYSLIKCYEFYLCVDPCISELLQIGLDVWITKGTLANSFRNMKS